MGTVIKLGILAAIVGGVIYAVHFAKNAASALSLSVIGYSNPSLNNWILTVPIVVRFTNPTPVPINLDNVLADLYVKKSSQWIKAGNVNQPLAIPSGVSDQVVTAKVSLTTLFGGNLFQTIAGIASVIKNKMVSVRTDITATYGLLTLPQQSFTSDLPLNV